jgi:hypothetical protein
MPQDDVPIRFAVRRQQRVEPLFQRAMDALMGREPELIPVRVRAPRKAQTRFEARLAALSR